ncbi:MAG: transporter, partial [Mesorhizobium sp.]
MLIGIPVLLGPELLATLRAMGHGDEIALVDGNYPAKEQAHRLIRADGHHLV